MAPRYRDEQVEKERKRKSANRRRVVVRWKREVEATIICPPSRCVSPSLFGKLARFPSTIPNYSRGRGGGEKAASQPASRSHRAFSWLEFHGKEKRDEGRKVKVVCLVYTHTHTHTHTYLYTHPFRVRERLSYRPGRVRVHANVWQVHSFHPRDPISLRGKGEKEKGGERESEPFRGRNSMQIRERDRSEAFDESRLSVIRTVLLLALAACTPRREKEWNGSKEWGDWATNLFGRGSFSPSSPSIHGPLPVY